MTATHHHLAPFADIEGVRLRLGHPDSLPFRWVGQQDVLEQLLAAWFVLDERDLPLNPRLIGKPGVGKTTLAYAAGQSLGRDVYIFQATMDTRPEDLIVTPVVAGAGSIQYVASPLVTAMIRGGVCVLDEGNRMSDDPISKQAEAMVVDALVKSKRFVVTENRDRADAILKGTAVEKRSQELHAISESGAASTAVVTSSSDYSANSSGSIDGRVSGGTGTIHGTSRGSASGSSSGVGVASSGAVEDSQVTTETIDDARISVRLVDPDGDVIWSTTQESRGAKYKGASADAADKITKQLLREIAKIEKLGP